MEASTTIYRVLRALSFFMGCEEPPMERLSPEALGCTTEYRDSVLVMLAEAGYVEGVEWASYSDNVRTVRLVRPSITLSGLSYLGHDPAMVAESRRARGIV